MAFYGDRYPTGEILSYVIANGTEHRYGRPNITLKDYRPSNLMAGDTVELSISVSAPDGDRKGEIREVWKLEEVVYGGFERRAADKYKFVRIVPDGERE